MRILLQDTRTRRYYCLLDLWTEEIRAAFDFRHTGRALEFAHRSGLRDIQLVIKFEDSQWDETFPVPVAVQTVAPQKAG